MRTATTLNGADTTVRVGAWPIEVVVLDELPEVDVEVVTAVLDELVNGLEVVLEDVVVVLDETPEAVAFDPRVDVVEGLRVKVRVSETVSVPDADTVTVLEEL